MTRYIDLFAGIGGFRYGIEKANKNTKCVYSNEWDKYANSVYRKHYAECDQTDIRLVRAYDIPDHDLLCGKNGVAAKELERQLGVTYKCAWRMAKQIRKLFRDSGNPMGGIVEVDETYIGGKKKGKRGRGADSKTPVFGIVERQGGAKAQVVENIKIKTIQPIINESVVRGATVMSDEFNIYNRVKDNGYEHHTIQHCIGQYVDGIIHSNSIEGFWSQLKRSLSGTHHAVSPKHLQKN